MPPLAARQWLLASDIAEFAVSDGGQVAHQRRLGFLVVDGHRSLAAVGVGRVDQDNRHAHAGQRLFLLFVARAVDEQVVACGVEHVVQAVHELAHEPSGDAVPG